MVRTCCVYRCPSKSTKDCGINFFQFPFRRPQILKRWVKAITKKRKNFTPRNHHSVCSVHFTEDDYVCNPGSLLKRLKEYAVPSIFPQFPKKVGVPGVSATSSSKTPTSISVGLKSISPKVEKLEVEEEENRLSEEEECILSETDHTYVTRQPKLLKLLSGGDRPSISTGSHSIFDSVSPKVEQFETVVEDRRLSDTDDDSRHRASSGTRSASVSTGSDRISPKVEQFETVEEDSGMSETESDDPPYKPSESSQISPKVELIYEVVEEATVQTADKQTQAAMGFMVSLKPARLTSKEIRLRKKIKTLQQKVRRQEARLVKLRKLAASMGKKKTGYVADEEHVIVIVNDFLDDYQVPGPEDSTSM